MKEPRKFHHNFFQNNILIIRFFLLSIPVKGLQEIEEECNELNIDFHLFYGDGGTEVPKFVQKHSMGAVVCDFCPLRVPMGWIENLKKNVPADVPVFQVDAHNIVPMWVTSNQEEIAAYTIRNKINSRLNEYLTGFPPLVKHPYKSKTTYSKPDWIDCWKHVEIKELPEITWATPGYKGGVKQFEIFCFKRLKDYATKRLDPTADATSDLSPWFHFGEWFFVRILNILVKKKFFIFEEIFFLIELISNRCK